MVIVGAGVAGGTAAMTLRTAGFAGEVVVVGDEDHPPYSRPPLSKGVLRGTDPVEKCFLRPPTWFADRQIEVRTGCAVDLIDPAAHELTMADGEVLRYDKLLVATGGRTRTLPGPPSERILTLRTIEDAVELAAQLEVAPSLIVVGAGFIGAEVASVARELGCAVTMLEAEERPLGRLLPPAVSQIYEQIHREEGVALHTGVSILEVVEREGSGVEARTADGRVFEADLAVVGIGMIPNVELAERSGLVVSDGVVVDELCRTSASDVFAAGDVANQPNPLIGRRLRVEHWQNAQHQAATAARNMLGAREAFLEVPWVWSEQYGLNLQITGDPRSTDDVRFRGDLSARSFSALLFREGRLRAAVAVDRPEDIRAARRIIAAGAPVESEVLCDPGVDLADLVASLEGGSGR
jgi:3-phenylpropionate/trans-cinnamate dioxygenase ferredoxin reductase subunit